MDSLVYLAIVVRLVPTLLLVSKVTLVSRVRPEHLVCLDEMDLLVAQEWTAFPVFLDRKEMLDHKASQVTLAKKVIVVTTVYPDCLDNLE